MRISIAHVRANIEQLCCISIAPQAQISSALRAHIGNFQLSPFNFQLFFLKSNSSLNILYIMCIRNFQLSPFNFQLFFLKSNSSLNILYIMCIRNFQLSPFNFQLFFLKSNSSLISFKLYYSTNHRTLFIVQSKRLYIRIREPPFAP